MLLLLFPQESARDVHWVAGRLRHKTEAERKISSPAANVTLVSQLVACHYIDLANQAARLITIVLNFRRPMKNVTECCTKVKTRETWRLSVYIHSALYWALASSSDFFAQRVGLLGRSQPVARPLPTHKTTQTQNKRTPRHPCLEWDSNPRSQCLSERRLFMP
jgi:hypothetical protein